MKISDLVDNSMIEKIKELYPKMSDEQIEDHLRAALKEDVVQDTICKFICYQEIRKKNKSNL